MSCLSDLVAIKEDLNAICIPSADEAADAAFNVERSPKENVKVDISNEPNVQELPNFPSSKTQCGDSCSSVPQANLDTLMVQHEEQKPLCNSINFCIPSELYQDSRCVFLFPQVFGSY